jgi:hypothetical protein
MHLKNFIVNYIQKATIMKRCFYCFLVVACFAHGCDDSQTNMQSIPSIEEVCYDLQHIVGMETLEPVKEFWDNLWKMCDTNAESNELIFRSLLIRGQQGREMCLNFPGFKIKWGPHGGTIIPHRQAIPEVYAIVEEFNKKQKVPPFVDKETQADALQSPKLATSVTIAAIVMVAITTYGLYKRIPQRCYRWIKNRYKGRST